MSSRSWQVLPAIALLSSAAIAQSDSREAWKACASKAAARFATGIDAADLIAASSLLSCRVERKAFLDFLLKDGDVMLANATFEQVERNFDRDLRIQILEQRSKRP